MFDFLRRIVERHPSRSKSEQSRPGVQLLASVLVCFPEIESVSYDPREGFLTMDFVIRAHPPLEEIEKFAVLLGESIETFHVIEGSMASAMDFSYEQHDALTILHLARRMDELSERELNLIAQLLTEHFGEDLLVDTHEGETPDAEFRMLQHETLERMLVAVREIPLRDRLVGIRERDQVIVYNR